MRVLLIFLVTLITSSYVRADDAKVNLVLKRNVFRAKAGEDVIILLEASNKSTRNVYITHVIKTNRGVRMNGVQMRWGNRSTTSYLSANAGSKITNPNILLKPQEKRELYVIWRATREDLGRNIIRLSFGPNYKAERLRITIDVSDKEVEQDGADQPATAPESKAEGKEKTKPESEVRPQ
jgi:hypothetical protein